MPLNPITTPSTYLNSPQETRAASSFAMMELGRGSKILPLKCKWEKTVAGEIHSAYPGRGGKFFVVEKDGVVLLNRRGEKVARFQVDNPITAGEGKDSVYIVSSNVLRKFDFLGNKASEKEFPKLLYPNYGERFYSSPVEDKEGKVWAIRGELVNWGEGCDYDGMLIRFSQEKEGHEAYPMTSLSQIPVLLDGKENAYIPDSQILKVSPDFHVEKLQGPTYHLFLVHDQPFGIIGNKLFRLDFGKKIAPDPSDEILHWNDEKEPVGPVVGKDGTIHLILRNGNAKNGLYIKLNPDAPPHHMVMERRGIPFDIDSDDIYSHPFLTPGGTLYFFGRREKVNEKEVFPVYAMDPRGGFQSFQLPHEPFGFFPGNGEEVLIPLKSGKVVSLEATSLKERLREQQEREMNRETVNRLGKTQGASVFP